MNRSKENQNGIEKYHETKTETQQNGGIQQFKEESPYALNVTPPPPQAHAFDQVIPNITLL